MKPIGKVSVDTRHVTVILTLLRPHTSTDQVIGLRSKVTIVSASNLSPHDGMIPHCG